MDYVIWIGDYKLFWNWNLSGSHVSIKHWIKCAYHRSARVFGLEEYLAHDQRAATSVQSAPDT